MSAVENATLTRQRYNRIAPVYDWMEALVERLFFRRWREKLWSSVQGKALLEVGVGTGKNMPYYPKDARVTAIDLSDGMLKRAADRAGGLGVDVALGQMDVQRLEIPTGSFDAAIATFVFCSVPDPVAGLRELARVVHPGGQIFLLDHVRVNKPVIGPLMDLLDPIIVRMMGAHINRHTADNVRASGLEIQEERDLVRSGLIKLIVARVPSGEAQG
jgi:phosphatidylethanolamine/phosphatidyl-N-methylethanolamine N-methyltransferase